VKFGVWYDFRNPPRWHRPYEVLYRETLDQAAWVDELGFDAVWLSEHHTTDEGYLPSIFPMLTALAMRTRRVRLGSAVILAPFQHPIRFAEDAAVTDNLSGGRLELGVAPGYRVEEFALFGIPHAERGSRTSELIEIARKAWTGERFDHRGRHWTFEDALVRPTPLQRPAPPVWIGGASVAAAKRAGRLGCLFMPDSFAPVEIYEVYRETLERHGHDPADFPTGTNRTFYVCDDPERGWNEVKEHILYSHNRYREWFAAAGDHAASGPPLADADELPRDIYVVGTPEQVIEEIEAMRSRFAFDHLYFWSRPPGLDVEKSSRSLELFAKHVIPHFAAQAVSQPFAGAKG
jgi:alkanesulfonate monooxygenase SsuD/methylene tetrahydromethanopterin reductase-like flavin-dependent oxidoreductase (luciferase family)